MRSRWLDIHWCRALIATVSTVLGLALSLIIVVWVIDDEIGLISSRRKISLIFIIRVVRGWFRFSFDVSPRAFIFIGTRLKLWRRCGIPLLWLVLLLWLRWMNINGCRAGGERCIIE
jgi:hypothetical protein